MNRAQLVSMGLALTLLLAPLGTARAEPPESFVISDATADNFLVRDHSLTAHVVRMKQVPQRLIAAFPAGNSGALLQFTPDSSNIGEVEVVELLALPDNTGYSVHFKARFNGPTAIIDQALPGSLREVRRTLEAGSLAHEQQVVADFEEAAGTLSEATRTLLEEEGIFLTQPRDTLENHWRAATVGADRVIIVQRQEYLGQREYRLSLAIPATCKALGGRLLRLQCPAGQDLELDVTVSTPYPPLEPLSPDELLSPAARAFLSAAMRNPDRNLVALLERAWQSFRFLSYQEKLLAGSFRFLTYFGRDTLITLRLLLPLVGAGTLDSGLGAVCSRLSPTGEVAHEEALGNEAILNHLAAFTRLQNDGRTEAALAELRNFRGPVYDYTMVDDNLLLVPLLRDLLSSPAEHLDEAVRVRLLQGPEGRRLPLLARHLEYVVSQAAEASSSPFGLSLAAGSATGNWRDSKEGLANGRYPADVNAFLVPGALVALGELLAHPLVAKAGLRKAIEEGDFPNLYRVVHDPDWLDSLLRDWETIGRKYEVTRHLPHLRSAAKAFIEGLTGPAAKWFGRQPVDDQCDLGTFATGRCYPADLASGLHYVALALDNAGEPIPVLHSDTVFALFDGPLPTDRLEHMLKAFAYPYPVGLWTPVGPVVANGLFAGDPDQARLFDNQHYHGAVVWGWVQGMLELAIRKQRAWLQELGGGCGDACDELAQVEAQLAAARKVIPGLATAELWTWRVDDKGLHPVAFGAEAGHATQANAVQLWSTVWLAVYGQLEQ